MPGLPRGTRVAGYRVEEEIAPGVYRAVQLALDRPVALKEVPGDDRTLRAWRLAGSIDHPHVIPVVEAVAHDGRFFVVMRLVEGGDLAGADLPRARAAALMEQVHKMIENKQQMNGSYWTNRCGEPRNLSYVLSHALFIAIEPFGGGI